MDMIMLGLLPWQGRRAFACIMPVDLCSSVVQHAGCDMPNLH